MLNTTCTKLASYYRWNIFCLVECVRRVEQRRVCIEVIILVVTLLRCNRSWNLLITRRSYVCIKLCVILAIRNEAQALHISKYIAVCLDDTTILTRECSLRVALDISTLLRNHHRLVGVTEVVVLYKYARTQSRAYTILGVTVIIVVIDVS